MKKIFLIILFTLAFVMRIFLSFNSKHGDMYNNWDWGQGAVVHGLAVFYDLPKEDWAHSRPNQPPGSIYLQTASYWVSTTIGYFIWHPGITTKILPSHYIWWWEVSGPLICLKLPSILADFVIVWALIQFGQLWHRPKTALLVALVYLFNPALWYNSSFWGQTDSVVAAFSLLSLLFLFRKQLFLSPVFLGLSLITKASWAPMVPFYLYFWWKNYQSDWPKFFIAPLTFYLLALPFHPHLDLLFWFTRLYLTRIVSGETSWITVIAFNFWNLFFPNINTPVTVPILGIPALYIAWALVLAFLVFIFANFLSQTTSKKLTCSLMLVFFVVFLFAPKMLQRYFYPVFPLLSIVLIYTKRKTSWFVYGLVSFCYLINMYYQWWAPGNLAWEQLYTPLFTKLISIIYLSSFSYLYVKKNI
jgi:dolichyl-phosphate-mannose-protein mannosyltransferase